MEFKNYICPVCNDRFNDGDDVVVCPECGTPHHRECYKKEGKCFNSHLHGKDENLKLTFSVKEEEKVKNEAEQTAFALPGEKVNQNNASPIPMPEIFKNLSEQINSSPASTHLIEGKPAVYYEIAVKKNQGYYIPRFLSEGIKKFSVNFVGFIMPLTWCFYRKLYKIGALILALYMLFFGITTFYMSKNSDIFNVTQACIEEDMYFMQDVLEYLSEGTGKLTENQQKFIEETQKGALPNGISLVFSILFYAARFIIGIKGNYWYMIKIRKTIELGEGKGLTGESLKAFIYRKNGTIPFIFAVIIGFFEIVIF